MRQDGHTKIKRSLCRLTYRVFNATSINLLRTKLRPLHARLKHHQPIRNSLISYTFSEKTKRDNAQKENDFINNSLYHKQSSC